MSDGDDIGGMRVIDVAAAKGLAHPTRAQIVAYLSRTPSASPSELAREWNEPVGNVAYHMRRLLMLGLVDLVERVSRRGAWEHRYRLAPGVLESLPATTHLAFGIDADPTPGDDEAMGTRVNHALRLMHEMTGVTAEEVAVAMGAPVPHITGATAGVASVRLRSDLHGGASAGMVRNAVLGLVIERPGYGYELVQRFEDRLSAWRTSSTAVYPALANLHNADLLTRREDGSAHRNVTWFEATDLGRAAFRRWMASPPELMPLRDEMHMKIALASVDDMQMLIDLTREQERACLDRVEQLTSAGTGVEALIAASDWKPIGHAWLVRTEAAQLATTIESLQEARSLMKDALRRAARSRA